MTDRRSFISSMSAATIGAMFLPINKTLAASSNKDKTILVCSGWQAVNIGDIGHTFGLLSILKQQLPGVKLILWPKSYEHGVEELLQKTFPDVRIVKGKVDDITPELQAAFVEASFMIHSSGPYVVAQKELTTWWDTTRKPFGIYGVSLDEVGEELSVLISNASFFYCRDTESLRYFKTLNNKCPVQGFAPDSTFGIKIYDDKKAVSYLEKSGLTKGEFICMIPRLRFTPYWQMVNRTPSESEKERYAISMAYKGRDGEKMRNVIISWVKATNLKVLICPEVTYQVEFSKETLYDPLPDDIRKNVVWRDSFWLPDEAIGVYKNARAMVCCEPHSMIMALGHGIPGIHVKQSTDSRKGQMWRDVGLGDWYFLMDETPASQISGQLMQIHNNYGEAQKLVTKSMSYIRTVQKDTMKMVNRSIN